MGYPRKSYPHRCPPPCAKRSRPRACARVYIIYRSPVGRSRGVSAPLRKRVRAVVAPCSAPPCVGWGRAKAKADAPSRSAEPCRLCAEAPCVLPAATCLRPRLRPLMGVAPCALPAAAGLPPRPRRLNGHPGSAGGRENDRMAHRRTTTPTHQTPRGNDTCTIRVPRRKGAQSVVHNLYFSSSRPASFCTTFPQSCTDRPVKCRKEHKWPPEGLIFRVLPPAFPLFPPESHCAKHPRTAPVLPPKNAPLRAYAKSRPHSRVRGTRQHATTCAFFTFSARYERIGSPPKTNFCPAEGRKWGRFRSQMLKNGLQTKKSTFSFGRLVI